MTGGTRSRTLSGAPGHFTGGLHEVGPGTWAWLQPDGGTGEANAGLVVGDGAALVVDTCWDHRQAGRLLDACRGPLEGRPITTVVNTHANGDHWWGNALMPPDAEIVTSAAALAEMDREAPREVAVLARLLGLGRHLPGGLGRDLAHLHRQLAPFDFGGVERRRPTATFEGRRSLSVGGRDVELIEVGPAHTAGDLVVHVADAAVVFAGDVVFVGQTPVMWAGTARRWASALERVAALEPRVVVAGHGPLAGADELALHLRYWDWLGAGVAHGFDRGLSALETTTALLAEAAAERAPWAGWGAPERTFITVATEYRSLQGTTEARSTREMLEAFRGMVRARHQLWGPPR